MKDGLPANTVYEILKDKRGFTWVATTMGIARYNGFSFSRFFITGVKSEQTENNIGFLHELSDTCILIQSISKNFYSYNYQTGRISNITEVIGLKETSVSMLLPAGNNGFWAATENGLYLTDKKLHIVKYFDPAPHSNPKVHKSINSVYLDKNGMLWCGMFGNGIFCFNPEKEYFYRPDFSPIIGTLQVYSISPSATGKYIAINGAEFGTAVFNTRTNSSFFISAARYGKSFTSYSSIDAVFIGDSILWIATDKGLNKFDLTTKTSQPYYSDVGNQYTLVDNRCRRIYLDNRNLLWVGTNGGLSIINLEPEAIELITQINGPSVETNRVCTDKDNNLWIGTVNGLEVVSQNKKERRLYPIPVKGRSKVSNVTNIYFDKSGNIWAMLWGSGICLIKKPENPLQLNSKDFICFPQPGNINGFGGSDFINHCAEDFNGRLWFSTWGAGLLKCTPEPDGDIIFTNIQRDSKRFPLLSDFIQDIRTGIDGKIYLLYTFGLQVLDPGSMKLTTLFENKLNDEGNKINPTRIVDILKNSLLIADQYGIFRFNLEDYSISKFFQPIHEGSHWTNQYTEDTNGNYWVQSGTFIYLLSPSGQIINTFDISGEEEPFDFYLGRASNDANYVYFTGTTGYLRINKSAKNITGAGVRLVTAEIRSDGKPLLFTVDPVYINSINLTNGQPGLSIILGLPEEFDVSDYSFKYKIEGSNNDWQEQKSPELNFSGFPTGEQNLIIQAHKFHSREPVGKILLSIFIPPPFYETWWFRLTALALLLGILHLIFNWQYNKVKREKDVQQDFSRKLIENQEKERKRLATELHDGIGQNLLIISNSVKLALMERVDKNVKLNEISDLTKEILSEIREISSNLHPHQLDKLGLTLAITGMISRVSKSSAIEISHSIDKIDKLLPKDSEILLYRIIQESLNNIIKHSGASKAEVVVKKDEFKLLVSITDNGKGFKTDNISSTGLGLQSISERVNLLNGSLQIVSAENSGTKIFIEIPLMTQKKEQF